MKKFNLTYQKKTQFLKEVEKNCWKVNFIQLTKKFRKNLHAQSSEKKLENNRKTLITFHYVNLQVVRYCIYKNFSISFINQLFTTIFPSL